MRITLLTVPARGDTEPFVALAVRLKEAGHQVKLAARPDFASLAAQYDLEFAPLGNPYQPFIAGAAEASAIGSGHLLNQIRYGLKQRRFVTEGLHQDALRAAQGSEAIIYKYPWITGHTVAEKLGVACAPAMLMPLIPTREFPSFMLGRGIDRGQLLNQLFWRVPNELVWQGLRWDDTRLRRQLGLRPRLIRRHPRPPEQRRDMPVFCAWSPTVLPRPADWPEHVSVTGYWFLDPPSDWQPPAELLRFLEDGSPPVSVGFGSMASDDRQATMRLVLEALEMSCQRAVLLSGWGGFGAGGDLPKHVFGAEGLPHSWLFPRMAAVVHHGGAGTTAAGLRSGVPSVLVPFLADQPSWARVVHALGAGPPAIPFQALTANRLADAIREAVTNPAMRQRAAAIAKEIRAEDGVGRAIELFLQYVASFA